MIENYHISSNIAICLDRLKENNPVSDDEWDLFREKYPEYSITVNRTVVEVTNEDKMVFKISRPVIPKNNVKIFVDYINYGDLIFYPTGFTHQKLPPQFPNIPITQWSDDDWFLFDLLRNLS